MAITDLRAEEKPQFTDQQVEFFEQQVRPLLVKRCYTCHSADAKALKGGLRLDSRALAIKGGDTGPAIVPGDIKKGLLVDAINYGELYQMPPKTKLPAKEIATLTKWVEQGAPWPNEKTTTGNATKEFDLAARKSAHWCWTPPRQFDPPRVILKTWPIQPLDYFVLSKLERAKLKPNDQAGRRTLIRRAFFDLIGLPPSVKEVDAFVADKSNNAFEKVIDQLLKSPHFGERWARHWMDLVRYAESHGHEFDYPIHHAYQYRDYLIRAFNADVPYNQFVKEHIAGDLIKNPRRHPELKFNESIIGTGFWFLGEATHAPVDVRGDEAGRVDNQIDVMSKTFLALTVACARCHDHKFDAIATKDYYALAGFLQSSRKQEALLDHNGRIAESVKQLKSIHNEATEMLLANAAQQLQPGKVQKLLLAAREALTGAPKPGDKAVVKRPVDVVAKEFGVAAVDLQKWVSALSDEESKSVSHPLFLKTALLAADADFAARLAEAKRKLQAAKQSRAEYAKQNELVSDLSTDSADWLASDNFSIGSAAGSLDIQSETPRMVPVGMAHSGHLSNRLRGSLRSPTFTLSKQKVYYRMRGQGVKSRLILDSYYMYEFNGLLFGGFQFDLKNGAEKVMRWHQNGGDVRRYLGHKGYVQITDHGDGFAALDELWLSDGGPPPERPNLSAITISNHSIDNAKELAAAYAKAIADATASWKKKSLDRASSELLDWTLKHGLMSATGDQWKRLKDRYASVAKAIPNPQHVLAITDGTGENEHVFIRGNHKTLGEEAPRQLVTALSDAPQKLIKQGSGRLELAEQIVNPKNALTSRVIVNRLWHHVFGRGIVPSTNNFGFLGQRPSHPALLDHLALAFVNKDQWSIKRFLKRLMLSSTYQMASIPNPASTKIDPNNLLLHRMNIKRLQGEAIRDAILSNSGRLDRKLFGPSVPVFVTGFMTGRGRPKGGPLDGLGRRSVYISIRRNFLSPMMLAFDTPIPFNSIGRRNVSNVPSQALILMNDPFVLDQTKVWARQVVKAGSKIISERIHSMYETALGRKATPQELADSIDFVTLQQAEYKVPDDRVLSDERLWADLAHVLWNTKPFIYLY
jgi:transposase-like protein